MQKALRDGLTASQLVNEWSGTIAQLNCNVMLWDVANSPDVPTLADVNAAFSNSVSVDIITEHLKSVLRYAGVELNNAQLAETALSILFSYWYLNLAELCIFFNQLKNGSRGQFVWGSKINNQAIMVALADFCKERQAILVKKQIEATSKKLQDGFTRINDAAMAIVSGLDKWKEAYSKAMNDIDEFMKLFPNLPPEHPNVVWFEAWKGNKEALQKVYGDNIPPVKTAVDDIGRYLCDYNARILNDNRE